jgi:flagellar hook-associated protein 3 FlgL
MRVTHQLIKNTVINNIHRNLGSMERYQNMLSSGKAINRPSDNPINATRVMSYNTALAQNEQYRKNIDSARSWIESSDYVLREVNEALQRARELALTGATGTAPETARQAIAMEVDELVNVLVQFGNSAYEGRYIFAGFQTTTPPFTRDKSLLDGGADTSVVYNGDQGRISWEVAPNVTVKGNIDGQDLFMDSGIFAQMDKLVLALNSGDGAAIGETITGLNVAIDHVLNKRGSLGAIVNGVELLENNFLSEKLNFTTLRSRLEDIDFAETIMNFSMMENLYSASIASGARIIQPSLLDFLR